MLLQKLVFTRRPSGPTIVMVTSSLLFILFLSASRSSVRAKASAYFPGSDSTDLDILQDVFNRTLGVSFFANTSILGEETDNCPV